MMIGHDVEQGPPKTVLRPVVLYIVTFAALLFLGHLGVLTLMRYDVVSYNPDHVETIIHHPLHKAGLGGYVLIGSSTILGHYGIQQLSNKYLTSRGGQDSLGFIVPVDDREGWMATAATSGFCLLVLLGLWLRQLWAYRIYVLLLLLSLISVVLNAFTQILPNPLPEIAWSAPRTPDAVFMFGLVFIAGTIVFGLFAGPGFRASMER